jgi:hypothetical protein
MPISQTHPPRRIATIGDDYNGTSSVTTLPTNALVNTTAGRPMTVFARIYYRGTGGGGLGYIASDCASNFANGFRFFINASAALVLGIDSTGVLGGPQRAGVTSSFSTGNYYTVAGTWDGTVNSTGIALYWGVDRAPMAVSGSYSVDTAGSGTINGSTATPLIGNRAALARTFDGLIFSFASWYRQLSSDELLIAQYNGPLAVPSGLALFYAGRRDYSTQKLVYSSTAAVGMGWSDSLVPAPPEGFSKLARGFSAASTALNRPFSGAFG